ncbi:MAG TPA: PEP-CTERM sorting domain-containing protein [Terriglobia bacterium]|nr:PEP-CTERM sorting domain-containing protein [Terriglobia bacterium]
MLKKVAVLAVVLSITSLPAFCSSIDFEGSGNGGTWSWNGSGTLSATSLGMAVRVVGSPNDYTISMANEVFTSGSFLGGSGTTSDPWSWGPSAANSFIITGCVPPATSCTPVTLFSGEFSSDQTGVQGSDSVLISATIASGSVDSALLSFLGLPGSTDYTGTYQVTLDGTAPGSGLVASGDLVLSPSAVPEPASLLLVGIGLLAIGAIGRSKLLRA